MKRLTRERAEHCDGLPGRVGEFENFKKISKFIVTDAMTRKEARQVEKVVSHARRVGGVSQKNQFHVAKHRFHMAKQFRSVQHNIRTEPHCICDRRLECETRVLKPVLMQVAVLSALSFITTWRNFAHKGKTRSRHVCSERNFWLIFDLRKLSAVKLFGPCCEPSAHPGLSYERSAV